MADTSKHIRALESLLIGQSVKIEDTDIPAFQPYIGEQATITEIRPDPYGVTESGVLVIVTLGGRRLSFDALELIPEGSA